LRAVHARLERLREQICDDHVICAGGSGRRFAEVLVHVADWGFGRPGALCSASLLDEDGEELQQRIRRLLRTKHRRTERMGGGARVAVAAFGLLAAAAIAVSGVRAAPAPNESQSPAANTSHRAPEEPAAAGDGRAEIHDAGPRQDPDLAEPVAATAARPTETAQTLAGQWQMRLPAGFVHSVTLTPLGENRYRLEPARLNSSGVYEVRNGRLAIVEPNDRRLLGFEWKIEEDGQLKLVGQPPLRETGSNYLGATMIAEPR
jgi:hypothetical protein